MKSVPLSDSPAGPAVVALLVLLAGAAMQEASAWNLYTQGYCSALSSGGFLLTSRQCPDLSSRAAFEGGGTAESVSSIGDASASVSMRTRLGQLGGQLSLASLADWSRWTPPSQDPDSPGGVDSHSDAGVTSSFEEQIRLVSPTLPTGTPVQLELTGGLEGHARGSVSPGGWLGANLQAAVYVVGDERHGQQWRVGTDFAGDDVIDAAEGSFVRLIDARIGDTLTVGGWLKASAHVRSLGWATMPALSVGEAEVVVSRDLQLRLASASDVQVLADSGYGYGLTPAVPEPATLLLALLGLAAVGWRSRGGVQALTSPPCSTPPASAR